MIEEEKGRKREGGREREEERGGIRVTPDHSHSSYICLSHLHSNADHSSLGKEAVQTL